MTKSKPIVLILVFAFFLNACSSTKVIDAWKGEQANIDKFKEKNVLVIARTANDHARIAFEEAITLQLKAKGIRATESFKKAPKIYPNKEISEERVALIKSLLSSEGYNGIVLTVIKDKQQTIETTNSGVYVGASYGGFYDYYAYPYAYGSYYDSFGGYIPVSTSTRLVTDYVLETVAYNLDEPSENQLVAITTASVSDPREAYKAAEDYAEKIMKSLE